MIVIKRIGIFVVGGGATTKKTSRGCLFAYLVAGAGIAPAPGGYEPPEVLLLHPAVGE